MPEQSLLKSGKKTLVLDLDETLIHSVFEPDSCEFVLKIEVNGEVLAVYVKKRPYCE